LRDFGPYGITHINVYVVTTVAMAWLSFVVKGFWALRDNITVAMVMLLKEAYNVSYYNIHMRSYLRLRDMKPYYNA
jgi:hypothetical protein